MEGQTVSGYSALLDTPAHRSSQLSPVLVVTDIFIRPCPALFCFLGPRVAHLRRRATLMQSGGNTSVPCSTDPPLCTPLCSTRSHRSQRSPASNCRQRSMKFRRRSDRPARENPLGWTGFLQRSSSQPVQWPSKHSTHSSPASEKKRMCPKKSRVSDSSPRSRTGAVSLTAATTGASLS